MLFSFAMIILVGVVFAMIMRKLGLPNLLGYLLAGIILGPFVFNVIDTTAFQISSDIRQIAFNDYLNACRVELKDIRFKEGWSICFTDVFCAGKF